MWGGVPHGGFGFVWRLGRMWRCRRSPTPESRRGYRNWPRYGLCWSGWYCNPAQHELCQPMSAVPDCTTNHDSTDRISGQFLFYHDHNFTRSKRNLRFQRLVPLFVPISVCVTTHDDGTASDVTICMWRHNQQATNHELNGKSLVCIPKVATHVICKWWYAVKWMILRKYVQMMPWI